MDITELSSLHKIKEFEIIECIGTGVFGNVYKTKNPTTDRISAVKVQKLDDAYKKLILKEFNILNDLCCHPNLPEFYGAYQKEDDPTQILFFIELCEGGPVTDLVRSLINVNRRMFEDHIAFILKETIKALNYLHGHLLAHGDVKGSNILLTARGEVKLIDFNLSRCCVRNRQVTGKSRIGSPCWMAPEIISGDLQNSYGSRSDVWSLAITAVELGDGKAPYEDMNPTRAIFQIERNPPAGLYRPHIWSNKYNDFISECLVKNPEHRPLMMEVIAHPFITQVPEKDYYLTLELAKLLEDFRDSRKSYRKPEILLDNDFFKTSDDVPQKMLVEDLSTLEEITEENILELIRQRYDRGHVYTFIGDILLAVKSDEDCEHLFNEQTHSKYKFKSLSDNTPHVFAIADNAYQNMLHYKEDQKIILTGETASGKTLNCRKIVEHLTYMGETDRKTGDLINSSLDVIILLSHARTPYNSNSTRCILQTKLAYSLTGNISGVIFSIYQLEKLRIAYSNSDHSNFHILRYFYDGMEALGKLHLYNLENETKYRFLRNSVNAEDKTENIKKFVSFVNNLRKLNFDDDQLSTIWNTLAAVLLIGNISIENNENELYNAEVIKKISENLNLDNYIFGVSIMNCYYMENNIRNEIKASASEVRENCDLMACTLYMRLVDWIVNVVNSKFSFYRALFGDSLSISILDMFGFESYDKNNYEQLVANCFNEQIQYLYHHLVFAMAIQEFEEEHIPKIIKLYYENNRNTLDELFGNPDGFWDTIDEANRTNKNDNFILDVLEKQNLSCIKKSSENSFTVVHYTGKVEYDIKNFIRSTNDILPREILEILSNSSNDIIKEMFTNKLSSTGNLVQNENAALSNDVSIWEKALVCEKDRIKKNQNSMVGIYSQSSNKPIACKILRSTALKLLKDYSVDTGTGSTHFIRCIRQHANNAKNFNEIIVNQQILALFVQSTAVIRKDGFPYRISFQQFLKRYKFLAFGFDENVEINKQNCRLLLLRLNMEGWAIGRTKVFLKYYNLEYLCRLHEYQMKKIVKTQCLVRSFLAKKLLILRNKTVEKNKEILEEHNIENFEDGNFKNDHVEDTSSNERIAYYCNLWKKHTIYEVILKYRAARQQDLIYLSQQVHIFNQVVLSTLKENNEHIPLEEIDNQTTADCVLTNTKTSVAKLPFKLSELHFYDSASLSELWSRKNASVRKIKQDLDAWDAPLNQTKSSITNDITIAFQKCDKDAINSNPYKRLQNTIFCRAIEYIEKFDKIDKINAIPVSKSSNNLIDKKKYSVNRPTIYKRKHSLLHTMPKESGQQNSRKEHNVCSEPSTRKLKDLGSNPIEELKLLGNKHDDSKCCEGPFNFQAMLRKTNLRHYSATCSDLEMNVSPFTKKNNESHIAVDPK